MVWAWQPAGEQRGEAGFIPGISWQLAAAAAGSFQQANEPPPGRADSSRTGESRIAAPV